MRSKYILIAIVLVALAFGVGRLSASVGTVDSPDVPANTQSYTLEDIYNRLGTGAAGAQSTFTEPAAGPGTGTMHDLNEIMAQAPAIDNTNGATETKVLDGKTFWGLTAGQWGTQTGNIPTQTVSNTTVSQLAGYYDAFDLSVVDTDLVSGNIRSTVSIYGVDGDPMVVNTSSGDAAAGDIKDGKKAWVDGAEVTGNIATQTVVNTTVSQAAGYYNAFDLSTVDTDLASGNVRSGVSIYGVDGDPMVVNTSSGTATASDILSDTVAYVDGLEMTGTMTNNVAVTIVPTTTNQTIDAGYHDGSGEVEGDADLVAGSIARGVELFGVSGICRAIRATGQTTSYAAGDDGEYELGCRPGTYPASDTGINRGFTDNWDGTVTDNLTGLIWLKDAGCIGIRAWSVALTQVSNLNSGTDFSCDSYTAGTFSDWRLPNVNELSSLVDPARSDPALPEGHPFAGVQSLNYWSSTTYAGDTSQAWDVLLGLGHVSSDFKTSTNYVWPVRGGQ